MGRWPLIGFFYYDLEFIGTCYSRHQGRQEADKIGRQADAVTTHIRRLWRIGKEQLRSSSNVVSPIRQRIQTQRTHFTVWMTNAINFQFRNLTLFFVCFQSIEYLSLSMVIFVGDERRTKSEEFKCTMRHGRRLIIVFFLPISRWVVTTRGISSGIEGLWQPSSKYFF